MGEVSPALLELSGDVARIREGQIAKPVREIGPISLRAHELALQCTRQIHELSVSPYPRTRDGAENLAQLVGACAQISLAATLCNLAVHHRTEIYLHEDADPTPASSREQLRRAGDEMQRAAVTYRSVTQQLSRRLASFTARAGGPTHASPGPHPVTRPADLSSAQRHARR